MEAFGKLLGLAPEDSRSDMVPRGSSVLQIRTKNLLDELR